DFFDEFEVDAAAADSANVNTTRSFSVVNDSATTGTGTVTVSGSASYLHPYSRLYRLECTAASGAAPNRLATLEWTATPVSAGNSALPPTPINAVMPSPSIVLDET